MKINFYKRLIYASFMLLIFVSCSVDSSPNITTPNETTLSQDHLHKESNNYFLSYSDALIIAEDLIGESELFLQALNYNGQSETDLKEDFWIDNQNILSQLSSKIELEKDAVPENLDQFENFIVNQQKIIEASFLSEIQKQYAKDLLVASLNDDFEEIVLIKNQFKKDVKLHPELEIFNMGMALVEVGQNKVDAGGGGSNCLHAALIGGVMTGIYTMINGAITGGLLGATIGTALTSGTFTVPAGGAGAVVGAVYGAVTGFAGGAILSYLGCLIFGGG